MKKQFEKQVMLPYNPKPEKISQNLRRNMTAAEHILWQRLKSKHLGCLFYRQKPIGDYVVDFYCPKGKLVIEVDGAYHVEAETAGNDTLRDEIMQNLGLKVLRFHNKEVLENIERVVEKIRKYLD